MTPVVNIDHPAKNDMPQIGRIDANQIGLPGTQSSHQSATTDQRCHRDGDIGKKVKLTVGY